MVGSCQLRLAVPGSTSLKDKRRVVRSLIDRAHRRFNVAMAEVDTLEHPGVATLGIACVSNDRGHAQRVLEQVVQWVEGHCEGDVMVLGVELI
ncbi:MAG: DUF503 domain-containing protein [Bacillota bacterium]